MRKAQGYLRKAIESNEVNKNYYSPDFDEAARLRYYAMCNWFIDGVHDDHSLRASIGFEEKYNSRQKKLDKVSMQLSLEDYLDAGACAELIARFDQAGLKKPANLLRIQGAGTMAYVIARAAPGTGIHASRDREGLADVHQTQHPGLAARPLHAGRRVDEDRLLEAG